MVEINDLKKHAQHIRQGIVNMVSAANSGHPGGSLSSVEILTTIYFTQMDINKENLSSKERDRFVLSKGHASPVLYSTLAEKGFIEESELLTFRKINTRLQGHPSMNLLPGLDMSTGSLGQGISAAVGMAISNKAHQEDHRIYTLLGDGECEEGQVWEAAMAAAHYKLDNLCAFVDNNGLQIDGEITSVMNPTPIDEKFKAFGWHIIHVDGHDFEALINACNEAKVIKGKPTLILAKTIKGKGVSFMENQAGWHGKAPNAEQREQALAELGVNK
ncbi:MAG: transketolase [Erysipelotrichaceae bacterium]